MVLRLVETQILYDSVLVKHIDLPHVLRPCQLGDVSIFGPDFR